MDQTTLLEFENLIRKEVPDFTIGYKNESRLQRVLGFLVYPFNPGFYDKYATTLGKTVWFPSQAEYVEHARPSFTLLAHEMVHLVDDKKQGPLFGLGYAFPQILAPIPLILYGFLVGKLAWILLVPIVGYLLGCCVARWSLGAFWAVLIAFLMCASTMAIMQTGWHSAAFFAGLALMAPWPSPWRVQSELRGYTMNLAVLYWTFGVTPEVIKAGILRHFTGPDYYFMSWSPAKMLALLDGVVARAKSGALQEEPTYKLVYDFLNARGLIRR